MNGKPVVARRIARALRLIPQLTLTTSLAITLAACATQPRGEMSIVDLMAARAPSSSLACSAQSEALVCESAGLRSRADRKCSCVDRREIASLRRF